MTNIPDKKPPFSKRWLCQILSLSPPKTDDTYTRIAFAHEAQPGCVAVLSVNTSDPTVHTSIERQAELADQAIKRGAKLLISTYQIKDYPCLVVDDILAAYCLVVKKIRAQFHPRTIGITGSIGKTTTTQMIYSVISHKYNTHRNDSSANNMRLAAGVIQNLKSEHEFYVQEIMEGPPYRGAASISELVQPQAAIVTLVGTSHMETFGSQERILESCLSVQDGMPADGLLILNGDDPFQWNAKCSRKTVYYAINNREADYRAENIHGDGDALLFDVVHDGVRTPVQLHCFGIHNVLNALAAFAAGIWANMTDREIAAGIATFRTQGIRQNFVHYGGKNLYLDCYNAAVESIQSSFDTLMMIPVEKGGRRIAVLGDIKESGQKEKEYHLQVGHMVAQARIDAVICYGPLSRLVAETVSAESSKPVYHTEKMSELTAFLQTHINNTDVILFKGSHSMALEKAVDLTFGTCFHDIYDQYEFRTKEYKDNDFSYRIHPDHVVVTKKLSRAKNVFLPDSVQGLPVTVLDRSLFNGSRYTVTVRLPETLINIGYLAFYSAKGLREITIPASVRVIENSAFNSCENLKTVVIKEGCTHIGFHGFANCPALEKIFIPSSVQYIGNETFINDKRLTIYGLKGTYAETYALAQKIPFVHISDPSYHRIERNRLFNYLFCHINKRFKR